MGPHGSEPGLLSRLRRRRARFEGPSEAALVAVAAVAVTVGLAAHRREAATPASPAESRDAAAPLPLPSGAPPREEVAPEATGDGCHFDDHGFGEYERAEKLAVGVVLAHPALVDDDGTFDLWLHAHGAEPVRRLLAPEELDLVIASVDAGTVSSDYDRAFPDPAAIGRWVDAVSAHVSSLVGRPARPRRVTVSAWSAGYAAMDAALGWASGLGDDDRAPAFGGVVLLDALYGSYGGDGETLVEEPLSPFLDAARRAAEGGPLFFFSHSEVPTEGYASTREVADYLLGRLDVTAEVVGHGGDDLLQLTRTYEHGHLAIKGYAGGDKGAHCAHLRLLPGVVIDRVLTRSPRD